MNKQQLINFLQVNPGYQKKGVGYLSYRFNLPHDVVKAALKDSREVINTPTVVSTEYDEFLQWRASKRVVEAPVKSNLPKPYRGNPDNVIVIGDLHAPFIREGYLEFIREQQEKYDCGTVIFIGDVLESGAWSYHESDPDGMSVGDELNKAKEQLQDWYQVFPEATVLYGNHDLLVARKAKTAGLSVHFIKEFGDIIGAPKSWKFTHEYIKDNVKYLHGSIGNAIKRAKDERISIVQGHLHTAAFVEYAVSERDAIFGMQVGCGIDHHAYAFEYARPVAKKPVISCGIILDKGTLPFVKLMNI